MQHGDLIQPVPDLLRQHAVVRGDQVAFSDLRRAIRYAELERRTARIAGHLAHAGVRQGDRAAILLGNRVEAVESCLAITRSAAVGVPLNPRSSDAELAHALGDSRASLVFTDTEHLGQVRRVLGGSSAIVLVGRPAESGCLCYEELAERDAPQAAADNLSLDDPAWLLYTSGTTGQAKGVLSSQRAALWSAGACYAPVFGLSSPDRLLWPLPLFHSFAHSLCILGVVAVGASAHVLGDEDMLDALRDRRITVMAGVPATYHRLVSAMRPGRRPPASLRVCITAGAPSSPQLHAQVRDMLGVPLLNGYGSTETCGMIAATRPGDPCVAGSCGAPLPGVRIRLVDPARETAVPEGEEGEIWVRGPGLMLGYHGQAATPFVDGWYRTGDLGRFVQPGQLAVTGRLKELIVRGGENIHPAEVEQILLACPGVLDAAVAGVPHDVFGEVPVAFVVPGPEGADPQALLAACRAELADFKVPDAVHQIHAVPRTPSGKVKRHELVAANARPAAVRRPADGALAEMVLAETAGVCGLPPGGPLDPEQPFTAFGMTSLTGVVLRDRLGALTGLDLPASLVFDHPTPAAVCGYLRARLSGESPAATAGSAGPGALDDPIAIVSMACRYPGGISSPEDLWRAVSEELDVTSDFPAGRGWDIDGLYDPDPDAPGKSVTRRGGFLHDAAEFDAGLFGVSPKEALATDPQQRLLLETSWELLERARIDPRSLRGSDTGVVVGVMYNDYGARFIHDDHDLESYLSLGSAGSVATGRVSYTLGLRGPSITVDTACSSSLVALHWAVRALRAGECSLVIAGGVTVMATPKPFIAFSRLRGLAPDGRCKSFSAAADGTAWSEGAGLLLLERLSEARRAGHPVLALVRGTAINSDGASNGLAAPNGPAQQQVILRALADSGLAASEVDVVDGHGTGTHLGDPIEAQALLAAYGQDRATPLLLGSVKSNIGHTQAAAGAAGVIKLVQAMRHGVVPRTLHADEPSAQVDWSAGAVELATEARPWPRTGQPRRGAVSSFGIGGTNAHVVLEQAPAADPPERRETSGLAVPWLLSGADEAALRAQAGSLAGAGRMDPADVAFSLATTRSALRHRAAVPAGDMAALAALAQGAPDPDTATGVAGPTRLAVLFTGQGAQRQPMGEQLAAAFPVFADAFRDVCRHLDPHLERPLADVITRNGALLDRTDFTQAATFAFEVAMFRMLQACGVRPSYLAGHSIGELSAAHVAGVFALPDAAALVAARGRLMSALPGGAMAAVQAAEGEVAAALADCADQVGIAAVNSPRSVVISGDETAVSALAARFAESGRRTVRLRVSHAFHSPLIEPMLADLRSVVRKLRIGSPGIPLISTVTGKLAGTDELTSPEYWARQAREPVRFADAIRALDGAGVTAYLEAGPSAMLTPMVHESLTQPDPLVTATSRGEADETAALLDALGRLHVRGVPVDWRAVFEGSGATAIDLPVYPFQRSRYWLDRHPRPAADSGLDHPVLSHAAPEPDTDKVLCRGHLSVASHPWLADHMVGGQIVVPATVFLELALRSGNEVGCPVLADLAVIAPLMLTGRDVVWLQVTLGEPDESGRRMAEIHSRPWDAQAQDDWTRHATGTLAPVAPGPSGGKVLADWPPADAVRLDTGCSYASLADAGLDYGPAFRNVGKVWRTEEDLFAEVRLPESLAADGGGFGLHPALLDAALHAVVVAAPDLDEIRMPFAFSDVRLFAPGAQGARVRIRELANGGMSLILADQTGMPIATVGSVTTRPWHGSETAPRVRGLYRLEWTGFTPGERTALSRPDTAVWVEGSCRARDVVAATHIATAEALELLQGWSAGEALSGGRLVMVTEKATAADPDLAAAAVWGLARCAQAEHPGRVVLIDVDGTPESAASIPEAIASGETQVAIRSGTLSIPKLTELRRGPAGTVDASGTVLVTGGTGALGSLLARHLIDRHGVRHLLLVSRRGEAAPGVSRLLPELDGSGTVVRAAACDVADAAALDELAASVHPPLSAIVHAAGVLDDGVLDTLTPRRMADVLRPKADAAWHLHELACRLQLRTFVLFSSAAGLLGNAGQGNYAAANSFLDALARHRAALGLPALSIAWGPWEHTAGMARGVRGGLLTPLTDRQGLDLFDAVLGTEEAAAAAVVVDRKGSREHDVPVPLRGVLDSSRAASRQDRTAVQPGAWRQRLASVPAAGRRAVLLDLVRGEVATVLGHAGPSDVPPERPFTELGFDSLSSILLRNRLDQFTALRLPGTVAFDLPTAEQITDHLLDRLDGEMPRPEPVSGAARPAQRLASLYRRVCEAGQVVAATHLLATASLALPAFDAGGSLAHAMPPERLAGGPAGPVLVCFPAFIPRVGTGMYGKLASCFEGQRDVFDIPHPGISGSDAVPRDWDTFAAMHARTVRDHFGDRPVILVGKSAGGCIAEAVATRLAGSGHPPAGLVIIDTYCVTDGNADSEWLLSLPAHWVSRLGEQFEEIVDDTTVAAMGAYSRIAREWQPRDAGVPTLFLRAQDPMPQMPAGGNWRASWPVPHDTLDVPGNHLELTEECAATTAAAVGTWVSRLASRGGHASSRPAAKIS